MDYKEFFIDVDSYLNDLENSEFTEMLYQAFKARLMDEVVAGEEPEVEGTAYIILPLRDKS